MSPHDVLKAGLTTEVYQVVVEALVALVIGTLGASFNAPVLKEITWASLMKTRCVASSFLFTLAEMLCRTVEEMDTRLGFADWGRHRVKA